MTTIQQKVVQPVMKITRGAALKALLFLAVIGSSGINPTLDAAQSKDGKTFEHQHDRVLQLNFEARALQDEGLLHDAEATFREALSIFPENIETKAYARASGASKCGDEGYNPI